MKKEIEEEEYEENDIHDDNKIQDVKENKTINLNTNNKVSKGNLKENCCQNIPIFKDKK